MHPVEFMFLGNKQINKLNPKRDFKKVDLYETYSLIWPLAYYAIDFPPFSIFIYHDIF